MQENSSEAKLSSSFMYIGARFIYTQWNKSFFGRFSFSQERNLNLLSENDSIWAANPTLKIVPDLKLCNLNRWHTHGFDLSGCSHKTRWGAGSGAVQWTGRQIPWASRHAWDNINCTLAQLPMFTTQEQIPQDRETGTHSPGQTSGKFDWIVKINKSLLWEQSLSGNVIPEEGIWFGNSWNVTGNGYWADCILIMPWA